MLQKVDILKRKTIDIITSTKLHRWMATRSAVRNGVLKTSYPDILSTSWRSKCPKMIGSQNCNMGDNADMWLFSHAKMPIESSIGQVVSHADWTMKKSCIQQSPYTWNAEKTMSDPNRSQPQNKIKSICCLVERMRLQQYQAPCSSHEVLETTSLRH